MLFEKQYDVYDGPDYSELIGDEWMEVEMSKDCGCTDCEYCACMGE